MSTSCFGEQGDGGNLRRSQTNPIESLVLKAMGIETTLERARRSFKLLEDFLTRNKNLCVHVVQFIDLNFILLVKNCQGHPPRVPTRNSPAKHILSFILWVQENYAPPRSSEYSFHSAIGHNPTCPKSPLRAKTTSPSQRKVAEEQPDIGLSELDLSQRSVELDVAAERQMREELEERLADMNEQFARLQRDYEIEKERNDNLQSRNNDLSEEVADLQKELKETKRELALREFQKEDFDLIQEKYQNMKFDNIALQQALEEAMKRIGEGSRGR